MAWTKLYPSTKCPRRVYYVLDMVQNGLAQTIPGDEIAKGYSGRLHRDSSASVPAPGVRAMAGRGTRDAEHEMRFYILSSFPCAGRSVLTLSPLSLSLCLFLYHVDTLTVQVMQNCDTRFVHWWAVGCVSFVRYPPSRLSLLSVADLI